MKKIIAVAVAGLALSTGAFAGTFDGVNADLGLGGAYTNAKNSNLSLIPTENFANATPYGGTTSSGDFAGIASLGYSQEIGQGFNLAANLFYVIGHQRAGSGGNSGTNQDVNGDYISWNQGVSNKLNNTWGISVEPGYYFGKDTLGYVKLAWVNSNLNTSANMGAVNDTNPSSPYGGPTSGSTSNNINGFGYGLGVKQAITENIYLKGEVFGVSYGKVNVADGSVQPSQVAAFLSVGYKF